MSRTRAHATWHGLLFVAALLGALLSGACENRLGGGDCKSADDCASNERCQDGSCAPLDVECNVDSDCGLGAICQGGACKGTLDPNASEGEGEGEDPPQGGGTARLTPQGDIDFGSPALGVGIERVISVLNAGGGTFQVTGLSREAGTSDEFTWSTDAPLPVTLAPGDRVEVTLVYTLDDGDDDEGTLLVHTTAAACDPAGDPSAIAVPVISEFKGARNLLVTPEEHDFGYLPPMQSSAPRTVLITNDGTIDKVLTVASVEVSGDIGEFDFLLPALPLYLAPGQSAEVPVVYLPTVAAPEHEITFTVSANSDNAARLTDTSTLRGTSQPPNALVWDPPELVFPELVVGQSAQRMSRLRNVGGVAIAVQGLVLGPQIPAEYSVTPATTLPYTLLPNASVEVYVEFESITGAASQNTVQALNNQSSGDVPVLTVRGDSYVPPGGPNVSVSMGPDHEPLPGCGCQATGNVPAANVDISYRALTSGAICAKPQNPACGLNGGKCDCAALDSFGDVSWTASRVETVRQGETWIVDEQVEHSGAGADGQFLVGADLLDDCIAVPGSTDRAVNWNCCMWMDCDGGPQACYDYPAYPQCSSQCDYHATMATMHDCLMRGPAPIKTTVRIWGGSFDETRYFCRTLASSGASADVVTLDRQGGYFTIASVAAGVVEVSAGERCPE